MSSYYNVTLETLGDAATPADGERFAAILAEEFSQQGFPVRVYVEHPHMRAGIQSLVDIDNVSVQQIVDTAWKRFGDSYDTHHKEYLP